MYKLTFIKVLNSMNTSQCIYRNKLEDTNIFVQSITINLYIFYGKNNIDIKNQSLTPGGLSRKKLSYLNSTWPFSFHGVLLVTTVSTEERTLPRY